MNEDRKMPYKRLVIITGIVLMLLLMILANTTESPSEGVSGDSEGASSGFEKNLPKEERIPTH